MLTCLASGFGLIDGPRWYPERGLVFSDMTNGGVHQLSDGKAPMALIPRRRSVGGVVSHADGGLVISGRDVRVEPLDGSGEPRVLLDRGPGERFFNDLTADGAGRLYVGSVAFEPLGADDGRGLGALYLVDLDGSVEVIDRDVGLSNGLAHSPSGRTLYHVDSDRSVVWALELDDDGRLLGRRSFLDAQDYPGYPDGVAVDEAGGVWVALAGAGLVLACRPTGEVVEEVEVPDPLVTSICFGGPDLKTMYITTGSTLAHPSAEGAGIFARRAAVAGLRSPVARI